MHDRVATVCLHSSFSQLNTSSAAEASGVSFAMSSSSQRMKTLVNLGELPTSKDYG